MNIEIAIHWNEYFKSFSLEKKDVYFTEQYVKLYETDTERAECFVCQEGDKVLLFPFLARTFEFQGKQYKDFETAYGYGGPLCNSEDYEFVIIAGTQTICGMDIGIGIRFMCYVLEGEIAGISYLFYIHPAQRELLKCSIAYRRESSVLIVAVIHDAPETHGGI